jgi:predicted amidophosphoribosyltransferase
VRDGGGVRSRVLAEILALVAPPACVACRLPLDAAREGLCPACRRALPWLGEPRCPRCALPAPCAPCPARGAAFACAWAPLAHAGPARALVNALKFGGALALADLMAAQLAAGAPPWLAAGGPLVPVPAHPARVRGRGFDQAQLLARALARRTGLPVAPCLRRGGPALRQLGASRRRRVAAGRIEVMAPAPAPERATLVDDVHTTGATLDECARALRLSGARTVCALTYSRTLKA